MNTLREICAALDAGYAAEKSILDDDMIGHAQDLCDSTEEILALVEQLAEARRIIFTLRSLMHAKGRGVFDEQLTACAKGHEFWVRTLPVDDQARVLALAQQRDPRIITYVEAVEQHGTNIVREALGDAT